VQPYPTVEAVCGWARGAGLRTHLDGARLFNAVAATGIEVADWARHFDTVSICFSKGLGAPVGSALAGPKELIAEGIRHRKVLGGGMRQAGVIAAAALYALENHVERLADDHANAQRLADGVRRIDGLDLDPDLIDTNMVFFQVAPALGTARQFADQLRKHGLLMLPTAPTKIRAVTHLDVDPDAVGRAIAILEQAARGAG
jgi:threonine aldolase